MPYILPLEGYYFVVFRPFFNISFKKPMRTWVSEIWILIMLFSIIKYRFKQIY